jgi:hypothetical protein
MVRGLSPCVTCVKLETIIREGGYPIYVASFYNSVSHVHITSPRRFFRLPTSLVDRPYQSGQYLETQLWWGVQGGLHKKTKILAPILLTENPELVSWEVLVFKP